MKCEEDIFVNVPNLIHFLLGGSVPVYKSTMMLLEKLSVDAKCATNRLADDKFLVEDVYLTGIKAEKINLKLLRPC